jgi:hypothetical protein
MRQLHRYQPTVHRILRSVRGDSSSSTGADDCALTFRNFRGSDCADVILKLFELLAQEQSGVGAVRESGGRRRGDCASGAECRLREVCRQTVGVAEIRL